MSKKRVTKPSQADRFREAAKKAGTVDADTFERAFKKVVSQNKSKKKS